MSKYPDSVGRVAVGREIKIVDDNGNELPPGEIGEIVVYGAELHGILQKPLKPLNKRSMDGIWV